MVVEFNSTPTTLVPKACTLFFPSSLEKACGSLDLSQLTGCFCELSSQEASLKLYSHNKDYGLKNMILSLFGNIGVL